MKEIKFKGDVKPMAICPKCNNPVVILGIYKKISVSPHARHAKGVCIPGVAEYDEYKYRKCPYHRKKADYIKEYVPETEEPQRQELYRITKNHFDKAIYLLQKATGILITKEMAEKLAENYASLRVYNYIDATNSNIPWYLIYSYGGFPIHHMIIRKNSELHQRLKKIGLKLHDSFKEGYVYAYDEKGYILKAVNYRYSVDKNDKICEWLDFSILQQDKEIQNTLLYKAEERFSIRVDSYYFGNLIEYKDWIPQPKWLEIAEKYMKP